ncbi:MAG: hypothetical protein IJR09_03280 [Paludibacteraceae bacterium]|nr:hypothetical protein [Paludibacteraceae bacterium]
MDSFSDFALAEKKTLASARANTVSTTVNVQIAGGEKADAGWNVTLSTACDAEKATDGKAFLMDDEFKLIAPAQSIAVSHGT